MTDITVELSTSTVRSYADKPSLFFSPSSSSSSSLFFATTGKVQMGGHLNTSSYIVMFFPSPSAFLLRKFTRAYSEISYSLTHIGSEAVFFCFFWRPRLMKSYKAWENVCASVCSCVCVSVCLCAESRERESVHRSVFS